MTHTIRHRLEEAISSFPDWLKLIELRATGLVDPLDHKALQENVIVDKNGTFMVYVHDSLDNPAAWGNLTQITLADVPIVFGPKVQHSRDSDIIWQIKPLVDANGGIFEIASTEDDLIRRIRSIRDAMTIRHSRSGVTSGPRYRSTVPTENPVRPLEACLPELPSRMPAAVPESSKDALGELPGIQTATKRLRAESGRLDANQVCELFGYKRAELARLLGTTSQALSQTPDSKNLQTKLAPFERIARLLVLNKDVANFRKWLNAPNSELGEESPLTIIKQNGPEPIALLVENILTGRGH